MEIVRYDKSISETLYHSFVENNLIYGSGKDYKSLITPSSTILEKTEVKKICQDLVELWELYRTWNRLYMRSLAGEAPKWIKEHSEQGMTSEEIEVSRLCSGAGLEPNMCRIDYTSLGEKRDVAEVQWRSGGLGLFFGIQDVYSKVIPLEAGKELLGSTVENFYNILKQFSSNGQTVVVSLVRDEWFKGEGYLTKIYQEMGVTYIPIRVGESDRRITEKNGHFLALDSKNNLHRINVIYGKGFNRAFPKRQLIKLARAVLDGEIWVETPLNCIYRQKWGLSFPFMEDYKRLFSKRLREIIIPTALINGPKVDLSPIVQYIEHPLMEKLSDMESIICLAELPTALRKSLVLKCGSGSGEFSGDAKGVFRLTGSRESAKKILRFVEDRIKTYKEPWIVQKFTGRKYDIPVSLPWALDSTKVIGAHARIMVFGGRRNMGEPKTIGGLGNYGKHWKVSGKSPCLDDSGQIQGTTFNDIRVSV